MYCKSLDGSVQGKAIVRAERSWGCSGLPLCKRKYQPTRAGSASAEEPPARLYGCHLHHSARLQTVQKHGLRPGWVDFSVWHGSDTKKTEKDQETLK
jgi:hypothetical protein